MLHGLLYILNESCDDLCIPIIIILYSNTKIEKKILRIKAVSRRNSGLPCPTVAIWPNVALCPKIPDPQWLPHPSVYSSLRPESHHLPHLDVCPCPFPVFPWDKQKFVPPVLVTAVFWTACGSSVSNGGAQRSISTQVIIFSSHQILFCCKLLACQCVKVHSQTLVFEQWLLCT